MSKRKLDKQYACALKDLRKMDWSVSVRLLQLCDYTQLSEFKGDVGSLSDESRREIAAHLSHKDGYVRGWEAQPHQFI